MREKPLCSEPTDAGGTEPDARAAARWLWRPRTQLSLLAGGLLSSGFGLLLLLSSPCGDGAPLAALLILFGWLATPLPVGRGSYLLVVRVPIPLRRLAGWTTGLLAALIVEGTLMAAFIVVQATRCFWND